MPIALLSAPSNLGLRPPRRGSVPGCAKAPEALREAGLYRSFAERGAVDAGVVLPGRYTDRVRPGKLRNQDAIVTHARRLAAGAQVTVYDPDLDPDGGYAELITGILLDGMS